MSTTPEELLENGAQSVDSLQQKWLKPLGPFESALHRLFYTINWSCIRLAFRFRVEGKENLLAEPPVIFAPNHGSLLDGPLLAAALPYRIVRNTRWAGRKGRVLSNPLLRFLNRVAQTIPIDRDVSALAAGSAVLRRGKNLVWFPEGTRTCNGQLQEFKFGVGALVYHLGVSVLPVGLDGAFEAYPPDSWFPRLRTPITVRFGSAVRGEQVVSESDSPDAYQEVADELHDRVKELN